MLPSPSANTPNEFFERNLPMTFTLPGLILFLIIAAVCGAIGKAIAGGARGGGIASTALGFIGAMIGLWVARKMRLPEPCIIQIGGRPFRILWSIIGAALVP